MMCMRLKPLVKLIVFSVLIFTVLTLVGCLNYGKYTVTFVYKNGDEDLCVSCSYLERPTDPLREGYSFVGWCTDADLTNYYDFSNLLNKKQKQAN